MKTNDAALDIITHFEGFRADPYLCPAKVWTIGYGCTRVPDGSAVTPDTPALSEGEARDWLRHELAEVEKQVDRLVKVKLTENQFGALVSFTFNLGAGNLGESTLLKLLNKGDFQGAAGEFPKWRKAGGEILEGLVRRRAAERELFES